MPTAAPICVIYNPSAGRGQSSETWQRVQTLLGKEAVYRPSQEPRHGIELARRAADEGFATIVAAGGDGTVHEVMNGVVASKNLDTTFAVLPLGSGNDYARIIGTPFDVEGMVQRLRSEEIWPVDVGQIILDGKQQEYFCNTVGIGLGGAVVREAKKIRWLRGVPLYGLATLKSIYRHFHTVSVRLAENNKEPLPANLLYAVVAIGKAEGGGFLVAPEARIDDGIFNLLYIPTLTRLGALYYLPRAAMGWLPPSCTDMQQRKVTAFHLECASPVPVHADGELLAPPEAGVRHCAITMLPGRLRLRGRPDLSESAG